MYALLAYGVIAVMILFIAVITAGIMLGTGIALVSLICRVFGTRPDAAIAARTDRATADAPA
jgi:hypothetical protein